MRTIAEPEFAAALRAALERAIVAGTARSVTGPGRSGAIAAVYASHMLGIPFLPFGQEGPAPVLVIDTAAKTGRTLRRAVRRYERMGLPAAALAVFDESPGEAGDRGCRVRFWYEVPEERLRAGDGINHLRRLRASGQGPAA
jgi:adenine/guanine phosphoribosyltransferase-like PRPP-binding protein